MYTSCIYVYVYYLIHLYIHSYFSYLFEKRPDRLSAQRSDTLPERLPHDSTAASALEPRRIAPRHVMMNVMMNDMILSVYIYVYEINGNKTYIYIYIYLYIYIYTYFLLSIFTSKILSIRPPIANNVSDSNHIGVV